MSLPSTERETFVRESLSAKVESAESIEEKLQLVNTSVQLQNIKLMLEKNGSLLFSDSKFAQPTMDVEELVNGASFLESIGEPMPSEEDIRAALIS